MQKYRSLFEKALQFKFTLKKLNELYAKIA